WRDGYQPLAMLDDDGDGTLTGSELAGVAVWHDANGNAVSDPGEVVSAESFGIAAIETRSTGESMPILSNPHGLRLRDGGTLPTYDWMPQSHPAAAPLSAAAE